MITGADVDRLRAFGALCDKADRELQETLAGIDGGLSGLPWQGLRAQAFRAWWAHECRSVVAEARGLLAEAAHQVAREADEQERASSVGSLYSPDLGTPSSSGTGWRDWGERARAVYDEWQRRWAPYDAIISLAPWAGARLTWTHAIKDTWVDWVRHAKQWEHANIGGPVGQLLTGLAWLNIGTGSWDYVNAMREGRWADARWDALGVGTTAASLSSIALLRAAGGVGASAQAGWMFGSWVYRHTGHTEPMIWIGDNIIGPGGDTIIGIWDPEARARAGAFWSELSTGVGDWFRGGTTPAGAGG